MTLPTWWRIPMRNSALKPGVWIWWTGSPRLAVRDCCSYGSCFSRCLRISFPRLVWFYRRDLLALWIHAVSCDEALKFREDSYILAKTNWIVTSAGKVECIVNFLCSSGFSPTFDTCSQSPGSKCWQKVKKIAEGFPGGAVVKNLSMPASVGDAGWIPDPGRLPMQRNS